VLLHAASGVDHYHAATEACKGHGHEDNTVRLERSHVENIAKAWYELCQAVHEVVEALHATRREQLMWHPSMETHWATTQRRHYPRAPRHRSSQRHPPSWAAR
jgi:hypothetical protein